MKKLLLLLSVTLFNGAWTFAQNNRQEVHYSNKNNAEALKEYQYEEPRMSLETMLKPYDAKSLGWNLERTESIEGGKVEHYMTVANDEEVHISQYIMNNGDFCFKDKDGKLVFNHFRITDDDGSISYGATGEGYKVLQCHYPNGVVLQRIFLDSEPNEKYSAIYLPGHKEKGFLLFDNGSGNKWANRLKNKQTQLSAPSVYHQGLKDPTIHLLTGSSRIVFLQKDYTEQLSGCLIGDRWYNFKEENGELIPAGFQYLADRSKSSAIYKGALFFAAPTDTLTDVSYYSERPSSGGYLDSIVFRYINGDRYKAVNRWTSYGSFENYEVGTMHKFGGILKLKKRTDGNNIKTDRILTMPDGRIINIASLYIPTPHYVGSDSIYNELRLPWGSSGEQFFIYPAFRSDSLDLCDGTITHPDGSEEKIVRGMTPGEQKKEEEAQEAKRKQAQAEAAKKQAEEENEIKAQYNELCRMYGKKYVDAALQGSQNQTPPLVGMPERLFVGAYKAERFKDYGNTVVYRVYGWGVRNNRSAMTLGDRILLWTVTVTNEKVASYVIHKK